MPTIAATAPRLRQQPYWWEAAPREPRASTPPALPAAVDTVVIGGGYAGLSAALTLARAGRSVIVLDAETPGFGGSSRSGGMIGHGHRLSYDTLKKRHGQAKAVALLREGLASLEFLVDLVAREAIDAKLKRTGRFRGAWMPAHYEAMGHEAEVLRREVGLDVEVVPRAEQQREVATAAYHGGLLFKQHGGVHPAMLHTGLLAVARAAGAEVHGYTPATGITPVASGYEVQTPRGTIRARDVVATTNGYTGQPAAALARKLVPTPSYLIATEVLGENRVRSLFPNGRMIVETGSKHLYYRPSPDGTRIVFGGRAALHPIPLETSAQRLTKMLHQIFPDATDIKAEFAWTGNVAFTRSDLPAIGRQSDGVWFAAGCNGSGVALMPYLGHKLALKVLGDAAGATAFDDIPAPTIPFYTGKPWFLPLMTAYFRGKDIWRGN